MSWVITGSQKVEVDPYRSQVSLLLRGDGTNGSTTITDNSPTPSTISVFGGAAISTAQKRFGTGSIELNGVSTDYLTVPSSSRLDMGTSDFTLECWIRLKSMPSGEGYSPTGSGARWVLGTGPANATSGSQLYIGFTNLRFDLTADGSGEVVGSHGMVINTWYHIAVTRSGTSFRGFVNGSQVGPTVTRDASLSWRDGFAWGIGSAEAGTSLGSNFNGFIDDLRITKGVARYTANFTPPTAAFPDI